MGIVAKYKYDGSVYADLIPEFNAEFTDYTITDEVDSENSNYIIRTIESESLPTLMRFGSNLETYVEGSELALLEVLDMNTSELTSCYRMFRQCQNLTSITCEWDTGNVATMYAMFASCPNLTTLDVSNFNTSKVTIMYSMFYNCKSLTSLNVSNFDTSKVTNMFSMFYDCSKLTSLDVSNFDTSKVTNMQNMFNSCNNLTSLDVSNFNTSNVTDMRYMFTYCTKLTTLDVSNFSISNAANTAEMFLSTSLLTDIGVIYCDKDTVSKVASLLPTDHNITIWVESDDILQYDQYDHITYKTQKVQDTVHLNSPLLIGDTIEVIDGKTYHVHRYEKVVLDGSEDWGVVNAQSVDNSYLYQTPAYNGIIASENHVINILCDKMNTTTANGNWNNTVLKNGISLNKYGNISIRCENITSVNDFKAWLSNNVLNIIVPLVTPYYELISEEPLELTLLDTTDNTINNNSILPSNMNIANKELSTIAIKPSTIYTLSFDKSNVDSEVTIDICGGEQITTVLNRIELTTPSELGSGIRFISSDGCIISNVRLLEGSLVEKAIPKETFEGLQSSFDDGYIIGESLITTNVSETEGQTLKRDFSKRIYKNATVIIPSEYVGKLRMSLCRDNYGWLNNYYITNTIQHFSCNADEYYNCVSIAKADITLNELANLDIIVLEGDHTHLSEAELMRYIEKGTSHYEEEDYNHAGKYKVEYKVTGKNKFNVNTMTFGLRAYTELVSYDNGEWVLKQTGGYPGLYFNFDNIEYFKGRHWITKCDISTTNSNSSINCQLRGLLPDGSSYYAWAGADYLIPENAVTVQLSIIFHNKNEFLEDNIATISNIQIEEGTVVTEYEPYKEDIKTYYLSSPLLKGDTIEDINGVATHVKRYEKVVLDSSSDENWRTYEKFTNATTIESLTTFSSQFELNDNGWSNTVCYSDKFPTATSMNDAYWRRRVCLSSGYNQILICQNIISDLNEFKQWLQANPTTVVYELASPIYEPISTESILCDSYVNGHLDFDTNVPIGKVHFQPFREELNYLYPNTIYTIQFQADKSSIINLYLGGAELNTISIIEGINTFQITTPETLLDNYLEISADNITISKVAVVPTTQSFTYFEGLKSTFECEQNDNTYTVKTISYNAPIRFGTGGIL